MSNVSIGFTIEEVTVNEEEDLHFEVCVSIEGADEIEQPFFVEFDLCPLNGNDNYPSHAMQDPTNILYM